MQHTKYIIKNMNTAIDDCGKYAADHGYTRDIFDAMQFDTLEEAQEDIKINDEKGEVVIKVQFTAEEINE